MTTISDIQLIGKALDNLPNHAENAVTAREIADFLKHSFSLEQGVPKKKMNDLLYHLQSSNEVKSLLVDGKLRWYRKKEKGEKNWAGNISKRLPVKSRKEAKSSFNVKTENSDLGLSEEELVALATALSLEDSGVANVQIESDEGMRETPAKWVVMGENQNFKTGEAVPIINFIPLKKEEMAKSELENVGLNFPFIKNHGVVMGTRYGKEPFYFEEVLFWFSKFNSFEYATMPNVTGASLAILKKGTYVYLFKERPEKPFNLPGGKREIGETPFQTLTRELKEEGVILKNSKLTENRFPDLISIGYNSDTRTYGYNWTWIIDEEDVQLPKNECKWVIPSEYKRNLVDSDWIDRVMITLHRKGLDVYRGKEYTTWMFSFTFKSIGEYLSVVSMKIPWNNMQ